MNTTKKIATIATISVLSIVLAFVMFRPLILPAAIGVAGLVFMTMVLPRFFSTRAQHITTRGVYSTVILAGVIAPAYLMLVGIPGLNLDASVLFHCSRCCGHEHLADGTYMHHNPSMAHYEDPALVFWHQGVLDDILPRPV